MKYNPIVSAIMSLHTSQNVSVNVRGLIFQYFDIIKNNQVVFLN